MCREVRPVTGRGEYILGSNRPYFYNFSIRETRVSTDHWMVLADSPSGAKGVLGKEEP